VGEAARQRFPGGVLVDGEYWEREEKVEKTRRAIAEGAPAIFEASFVADDVFVAVDVLERRRDGWNLVEVKSTTKVKEPHFPDVAVQLHVVRSSGLEVRRADLMHLNSGCTFPDLSDLFTRSDVTAEAEAILPGIPAEIRRLKRVMAGSLPDVAPGPHCTDPYDCPFMDRCWSDLPDHVRLNGPTARQVRSVRQGKVLAEPELAGALASVEPPIAFLDFETINPPIPVWNGCHPFQAIPVQMSCHVLGTADGSTTTSSWPRAPRIPGRPSLGPSSMPARERGRCWRTTPPSRRRPSSTWRRTSPGSAVPSRA
jgi:hypothetical protein